jgi:GAF domain-containing protein
MTSVPETGADQLPQAASIIESSDDWEHLHEISTSLISENSNLDSLYNRILDAAVGVMSSDMASIQSLDPERNKLQLLAWQGFDPQSAAFWEWVYLESASTCGLALFSGCRVVVPDVETCNFMAGTADLEEYRRSNIRAVQSTPLVSRSGQLLGIFQLTGTSRINPLNVPCSDWMFLLGKLPILSNVAELKPRWRMTPQY